MQKFDLHMHTTFCDGNDTAEDMVLAAIDKGLEVVGLSGHSFTWFDQSYCMSQENTRRYIEEVKRLKARYEGRIRVLLGTELDYHADIDTAPYDYIIGSGHYILADDPCTEPGAGACTEESEQKLDEGAAADHSSDVAPGYIDTDYTPEILLEGVKRYFGGDIMAACEKYYEQMGNIVRKTHCDIIGHFDLITKFNEQYVLDQDGRIIEVAECQDAQGSKLHDVAEMQTSPGGSRFRRLIDTENPRYINAWKKAVDQIFRDTKELRTGSCAEEVCCEEGGYAEPGRSSREGDLCELILEHSVPVPNRLERLGVLKAGDKPVFEINLGAIAKGYRTVPYPAKDQIEYIRSLGGVLILSSDSHSTKTVAYNFSSTDI